MDNIKIKEIRSFMEDCSYLLKVLDMKDPRQVNKRDGTGTLKLQELTVTDDSALAVLTLWEGQVGKMEQNKIYKVDHLKMSFFNGDCKLSSTTSTKIELVS